AATTATGRVGGRVNINTAPRAVLRTIPGIDASTVEQIILRREAIYDPIAGPQRHALWLLTDSLVDLATMRKLEPYVTGGGNVFSGEVVGFYDDGGAAARLFVVIDRTDGTPRIVRREDRTTLDPGLAPVALGAQLDEF
ncbi:MAG: hypothetical protein KDA44_17675, partial [Planctomycetales bacterium]|nr:hypothetical protein [Planctomycetales bacterium]